MSATLRLLITSDWPSRGTECAWALLDDGERLRQQGSSEPRHWPAAERCEVVLSAEQALALDVKLPKGSSERVLATGRSDGGALAYAIEERLIADVEADHFVSGRPSAEGTTPVWVVSKTRLRALVAALTQLGRPPVRVLSELQLVPLASGSWSLCVRQSGAFVRTAAEAGFALDEVAEAVPVALRLAVQKARQSGLPPKGIDLYLERGVEFDSAKLDHWRTSLGVPMRITGDYAWRSGASRGARNLLVGEFSPAGERAAVWAPFRPAIALGAAALVLYMVSSLGEWMWLEYRAGQLRGQATEVFRAAFPRVQTIVDPILQMQRLHDQLRRERGQLGESDFLPILASVTQALAGKAGYRGMAYEDGRLEFSIVLQDVPEAERLRGALARQGLVPALRETRPAGAGVEASYTVRRGQ